MLRASPSQFIITGTGPFEMPVLMVCRTVVRKIRTVVQRFRDVRTNLCHLYYAQHGFGHGQEMTFSGSSLLPAVRIAANDAARSLGENHTYKTMPHTI
ncbi:MAG: hypothetical protein LBS79_01145 [Tannerella sp.]|nr:hypothetical protein [Tannerella sp.]